MADDQDDFIEGEFSPPVDEAVEEPPARKTTGQHPQRREPPAGHQVSVAVHDESVSIPANLMRGADLEETPPEPAELGLEPGGRYLGHTILHDPTPQDERHAHLFQHDPPKAFYVQADDNTIGLVPWLGSTIIWPWEKAWEQDLYHEQQDPKRQALMKAFVKAKQEKK